MEEGGVRKGGNGRGGEMEFVCIGSCCAEMGCAMLSGRR
jgi:hypothetical protein